MEALEKQPSLPLLLVFAFLLPASSLVQGEDQTHNDCSPFPYKCGGVDTFNISYPFWTEGYPRHCSHRGKEFKIGCNQTHHSSEIETKSHKYHVKKIDYENRTLTIVDEDLVSYGFDLCSLPIPPFKKAPLHFEFFQYEAKEYINLTLLYSCPPDPIDKNVSNFTFLSCLSNINTHAYFTLQQEIPNKIEEYCDVMKFPVLEDELQRNPAPDEDGTWKVDVLGEGFKVTWSAIDPHNKCANCVQSNGHCGRNESSSNDLPICYCNGQPQPHACPPQRQRHGGKKKHKYVMIGVVCAVFGSVLIICAIICYIYRKRLISSSKLLSRALSSDPPLRSDLEKSNSILMTHFFEYKELEEATNNFDPSKELGDGGFGIVYHGELRDGRNVAVKRLYENNCRCVEQFKNEIKILSQLRHQNLVTLYGCSSRHSRELLLVYEFIPNGTVADHLHGDRAKPGALIWPTRMSIAIETADALKYLHAVDIIHRDVKTNNILLDNNFHVKVADFGLSRLFPTNVTHISTAPQGTPGYVDPDYHRCYQLTDKSDVYSFGVVLIELISSKPAVDITRHRHEINLADMALNKIQNCALNELVDPTLEFDSNFGVRRMITSVAELAFRCLQDEKENRPSMEEVLELLRGIESEEYYVEKEEVNTVAKDEALLKKSLPLSPDTVTDAWESRTTTPNTSG